MATEYMDQYPELKEFFSKLGFGGRVGFGERPALIVIDMAKAWTDTRSPLGSDLSSVMANNVKILHAARQTKPKIPIFFGLTSIDPSLKDVSEVRFKKRKTIPEYTTIGSEWLEIDTALERKPDELIIPKKHLSCFFATDLGEILVSNKVDTLIITGCSTSNCIRSTAQDTFQYGFHAIVPEEAVGDRNPARHKWGLIDIDLMWGDVVKTDAVLKYLAKFKA